MKTSVFVGTSVDGFLARKDHRFDFLTAGGEDRSDNGYDAFFATVDVLVIGRNTYDVVLPFPEWPYGPKPVVVLSSRPLVPAPPGANVEWMSASPAEVVARLTERGFLHAYVDGGLTVQSFLRARLIDRIVVTRVPVLIGSGIPLFGPLDADMPLRHVATRQLSGGAVQSEYEVVRTDLDGMKDFATRYTAAWCSQKPTWVASFFAPDGSLTINDGPPSVGREAIAGAARGFMTAFPDMVVTMDALERDGTRWIYRWTLAGTHTGPGGSGNQVRMSGYEEWTMDANGLIQSSLGHFDAG